METTKGTGATDVWTADRTILSGATGRGVWGMPPSPLPAKSSAWPLFLAAMTAFAFLFAATWPAGRAADTLFPGGLAFFLWWFSGRAKLGDRGGFWFVLAVLVLAAWPEPLSPMISAGLVCVGCSRPGDSRLAWRFCLPVAGTVLAGLGFYVLSC